MGFFSKLFSSSKSVEQTVETVNKGVYNGIDMMFFTDEEKNTMSNEAQGKILDFHLALAEKVRDESSIRSITRRILAVMIMSVWVLLVLAAAVLIIIGKKEEFDAIMALLATISSIVLSVVVFYFGPEVISRIITRVKSG